MRWWLAMLLVIALSSGAATAQAVGEPSLAVVSVATDEDGTQVRIDVAAAQATGLVPEPAGVVAQQIRTANGGLLLWWDAFWNDPCPLDENVVCIEQVQRTPLSTRELAQSARPLAAREETGTAASVIDDEGSTAWNRHVAQEDGSRQYSAPGVPNVGVPPVDHAQVPRAQGQAAGPGGPVDGRAEVECRIGHDLCYGSGQMRVPSLARHTGPPQDLAWPSTGSPAAAGGQEAIAPASSGATRPVARPHTVVEEAGPQQTAFTDAGPATAPGIPPAARAASTLMVLVVAMVGIGAALVVAARLVLLGYARIAGERVKEHPMRARLLELLDVEPGLHLSAVRRRLACSSSTALHHIRRLKQEGLIIERKGRGYTVYGLPKQRDILSRAGAVCDPKARAVLAAAVDGSRQLKQLQEATGLPRNVVHYHVRRLAEKELVHVDRPGNALMVQVTSAGEALMGQLRGTR